jgi:hypothetical protein
MGFSYPPCVLHAVRISFSLSPSLKQQTANSAHYEAPPGQHEFTKYKSTVTIWYFISNLLSLSRIHRQPIAIYFDLSSESDLVLHILLLHKLNAFGIHGGYVNKFCSYLKNRQSQIRVSQILSLPSEVLSGVPQGSVLGPTFFRVFIKTPHIRWRGCTC